MKDGILNNHELVGVSTKKNPVLISEPSAVANIQHDCDIFNQ